MANKTRPEVECPKCEGTGTIKLADTLLATLALLRKRGKSTAPEIWEASEDKKFIGPTAINRRLETLREYGLVDREREGKVWKYFATESKP